MTRLTLLSLQEALNREGFGNCVCVRASGTADVVDASVVVAARRHRATVVSSDRGDLEILDPNIAIVDC